jgi:hypothetical protein
MCSAFGGATPCLHPHGHKGKCMHHGGDTAKSVAPLQGRGFLTAHHGVFFVFFFQLLFSLLNNPLFASPIIQALKNPVSRLTLHLLHSSKKPVSLLKIYPGSYCTFCQGKPSLAGKVGCQCFKTRVKTIDMCLSGQRVADMLADMSATRHTKLSNGVPG